MLAHPFLAKEVCMPKRRIVVIDDCRLTLAMAREILEGAAFEVFTAETGIDANQAIYGAHRPDLILLDVEMPLLRGDRKARLLKQSESSRDIPIILISHKPAAELEQLARAGGADGYLVKPIRREALLREVARHLGGQAAQAD
jgi:CheY-like chemotaxis protein